METLEKFWRAIFDESKRYHPIGSIQKLQEKMGDFFKEFVGILLDDQIFPKENQEELVLEFIRLKREFLETLQKPWLLGKSVISFAGKFSAGKSSILNTLIGRDLLPVDVTPTTAVPTYLTYVKGFSSNEAFIVSTIHYDQVVPLDLLKGLRVEEVKACPVPLSHVVKYFVLNLQEKFMFNKVIIDTPGYNPGDSRGKEWDKRGMEEAIGRSDAVFWVVDISDGDISRDSLDVLKKAGNRDLYIVLNQIDKKPPSARVEVKRQIEKTLHENNVEFKEVLFFTSRNERELKKLAKGLRNTILKYGMKEEPLWMFIEERLAEAFDKVYPKKQLLVSNDLDIDSVQENVKKLKDCLNDLVDELKKAKKIEDPWEIYNELSSCQNRIYEEMSDKVCRLIRSTGKPLFKGLKDEIRGLDVETRVLISEIRGIFKSFEEGWLSSKKFVSEEDWSGLKESLLETVSKSAGIGSRIGKCEEKVETIRSRLESQIHELDSAEKRIRSCIKRKEELREKLMDLGIVYFRNLGGEL